MHSTVTRLGCACAAVILLVCCTACSALPLNKDGGFDVDVFLNRPLTLLITQEAEGWNDLFEEAEEELGFKIESKTCYEPLLCAEELANHEYDGEIDGAFLPTNRLTDLTGGTGVFDRSVSIANSPLAVGVRPELAAKLGWDEHTPTWADVAQAAMVRQLIFGVGRSEGSFSKIAMEIAMGTSLMGTGEALTPMDVDKVADQIADVMRANYMEVYVPSLIYMDLGKRDEINSVISFEADLVKTTDDGVDLEVFVPSDGSVNADYVLSSLAHPRLDGARDKVDQLTQFLLDHQKDIADAYYRPVARDVPADYQVSDTFFEMPFPQSTKTVEKLDKATQTSANSLVSMYFVLDSSEAMKGQRLDTVKQLIRELNEGPASPTMGNAAFRNDERVQLTAYNTSPVADEKISAVDNTDPKNKEKFPAFLDSVVAEGGSSPCDALIHGLLDAEESYFLDAVILFTSGEETNGSTCQNFQVAYSQLSADARKIPVVIFAVGDEHKQELTDIAQITGGKIFPATEEGVKEGMETIR